MNSATFISRPPVFADSWGMTTANVYTSLLKRRTFTAERRLTTRSVQMGPARLFTPHASGYFAGYATTSASAPILLRNVSAEGLGFTSSQSMEPGKKYIIESSAHNLRPGAAVRVIWCREAVGNSGYECGAEFC